MEIANLIAALRAPDCDNCPCTECKPDRNLTRCMLFDKAADAVPAGITIRTYNNGVLVEEYAVESEFEITRELAVIHNFDDFDTMEVEFTKTAEPYNRIVLNYFSFGDITNFTMERMDMTSSPKAINSQHMYGETMDIRIDGVSGDELLAFFLRQPEVRYAYKINSTNVHFDIPKGAR